MTGKPGLGSLGRRLLLAFTLVALASILLVTVAALIGSDRGITASSETSRADLASQVASQTATAYAEAGGWPQADLAQATQTADSNGARLVVRDANGTYVGGSDLPGMGMGMNSGGWARGGVEEPVIVDGRTVGSVRLGFGSSASDTGRGIAWTWILAGALAVLVIAVVASWLVTRQITDPINRLTRASAAFAAGDRTARAHVDTGGEIGELARTFDATADAVARAELVRRNLSADVAHELRTPLTALLAELEELRDGLTEADEETLTRLHDQAMRMNRIVNDLAALTAAEAPDIAQSMAPADLADLARTSVAGHSAQLRAAEIDIEQVLDGPLPVVVDADRIRQVVDNLLSNAARYCRPGDRVSVRTYASGDACILDITDTGPGIAAQDLPHVFERFWRSPATASVSGSGIGLAVARSLVTSQGGTIIAESDGTSGTTFRVSLPRASA